MSADFATLLRVLAAGGVEFTVWTADGRRLVFNSQAVVGGPQGLYWQAGDGTGAPERLTPAQATLASTSVTPDGAGVVFTTLGNASDVMMLTLDKDRRTQPLVQTPFSERNAEVSPDGRWLAYEANDSGQFQVYVRPFPAVNSGRWQISTDGGTKPVWVRSGQELFYLGPGGALMGIRVETGSVWMASTPTTVLEKQFFQGALGRTYDVSPDGKRFLMIKPDPSESPALTGAPAANRQTEKGLIVVQHWTEELRRLVPRN